MVPLDMVAVRVALAGEWIRGPGDVRAPPENGVYGKGVEEGPRGRDWISQLFYIFENENPAPGEARSMIIRTISFCFRDTPFYAFLP